MKPGGPANQPSSASRSVPSSPRKRRSDVSASRTSPPLKAATPRIRSRFGFTLLEVMIALLVTALGIAAVINTTTESGWKSALLKQKTIASWVAQNQIALYRAKRTWNNASTKSGEVEMANAVWIYRIKISPTEDPGLRQIDVDVLLKSEDGVKASVTGFFGKL